MLKCGWRNDTSIEQEWRMGAWEGWEVTETNYMEQKPEEVILGQLFKKFPWLHGTPGFVIMFTTVHHWSPHWTSCVQSIPSHHTSIRSILILSSYLQLDRLEWYLTSGFLTKFYMRFFHYAMCPANLFLFDLISVILLHEKLKLWSFSLCFLLQHVATSILLGPNVLHGTTYSKDPQSVFFTYCERPSFTPMQNNR
jgi:hypothetical protein